MRAQSSLEYMALIAIVLIMAAFSVNTLIGVSKSKDTLLLTNCQTAADRCDFLKKINGTSNCNAYCMKECSDPLTELDLLSKNPANPAAVGAVRCCNNGNSTGIYFGSRGC